MTWINTLLLIIYAILCPESPHLFSSVMPQPENLGYLTRAGFVAIYTFFLLGSTETWILVSQILIIFQFTTSDLLNKFGGLLRQSKKNNTDSKMMQQLLHYHRCFTIQTYNFKQFFGLFYGVSHVTAIMTISFCNYEAVRLSGTAALGMGFSSLCFTMNILVFIDLIAEVNRQSQLFLVQVRRSCAKVALAQRRAVRAEILSMRECRVEFGHLFFVDKGIILTTLAIIVQNTVNLILA